MSERHDESNNMNPTAETIAHRHRIGPPRWGFGSFRGPLPRPMAWADIGLSRCDVGAPVNDTRAGFGSGTHFHPIVGGGGRSRTTASRKTCHHAHTVDPRQTRTDPDNSETPNGVARCQPRPSAWVLNPTPRNITPTGWPEIRDRQQKPITTNDRRPNDTMNQTT